MQLRSSAIELRPGAGTEAAARRAGAQREHGRTHLDVVVDMYEAAALQNGLGQCRNEDLLLPFCVFPGFHSRAFHLRDGPQVINPPLGFISHFLCRQEKIQLAEGLQMVFCLPQM